MFNLFLQPKFSCIITVSDSMLNCKAIYRNWEVLIVTYDGKLRGYLVSQTEGFKIHHTFKFSGGVSAVAYSDRHSTLYVAGVPRGSGKVSFIFTEFYGVQ